MNTELEELYQSVILDHSRRPRNKGEIGEGAVHVHGDNPSCGDEIHLHVKFGADGGVEDLKFTGQGCAISQASASMLCERIAGRPYFDDLLKRAMTTYAQKYQVTLPGPVQVEVYPNHDDFAVRTEGLPGLGALGVTFGNDAAHHDRHVTEPCLAQTLHHVDHENPV